MLVKQNAFEYVFILQGPPIENTARRTHARPNRNDFPIWARVQAHSLLPTSDIFCSAGRLAEPPARLSPGNVSPGKKHDRASPGNTPQAKNMSVPFFLVQHCNKLPGQHTSPRQYTRQNLQSLCLLPY